MRGELSRHWSGGGGGCYTFVQHGKCGRWYLWRTDDLGAAAQKLHRQQRRAVESTLVAAQVCLLTVAGHAHENNRTTVCTPTTTTYHQYITKHGVFL